MGNPASQTDRRSIAMLWVDDQVGSLDACIELLRLEGVDVESAASGTLGIALAAARAFDVILLDLRLPDLSGLEVLHELRRAGIETPVAVVSGFLTRAGIMEATQLGVAACVTKPVFDDDLLALVRRVALADATPAAPPMRVPERHGVCGGLLRAVEYSQRLSTPQATMSRALLDALMNPAVSTLTFGICARALRVLYGETEPAWSDLRDIMAKAPVSERTNCPPAVSRALADLERADGIPPRATEAGATTSQRAVTRQRLRTWTNRAYRDWKRVLRVRPVLERLVTTKEHISQIAYQSGYEHPSQLDHDFHAVFGLSPKLFRNLCYTYGITSSARVSVSAAESVNSRAAHSRSGTSAQAIAIDERFRVDDAERSRGADVPAQRLPNDRTADTTARAHKLNKTRRERTEP